ncbi:MAG: LacI family DNA-binding transcriptional regulator [Bacteroidota bacterium]
MSRKQVTLADLAQKLGISTATVSRALKDYPDISPATKKKVLALANEWNYRPNSIAAGLRKRESKIIGVIIPSIVNHFFSSVIRGIMQVAYEADYRVMLCQTDESFDKEVADTNALYDSRVDGLLVSLAHETQSYDHFQPFFDSEVPIVFFDKVPFTLDDVSRVVVDDYKGAFLAVEHLIKQGCKKIAHFRGPLSAYTSHNRFKGYQDAVKKHGLPTDESLIFDCDQINIEEGKDFARQLMKSHPDCDGIFTITDSVGIGAMTAIKEMGLKIPEDVSVVGFSDWEISSVIQPSLTSVSQPSLQMGRQAASILLEEIQAIKDEVKFAHKNVMLDTKLKIRESSRQVKKKQIVS